MTRPSTLGWINIALGLLLAAMLLSSMFHRTAPAVSSPAVNAERAVQPPPPPTARKAVRATGPSPLPAWELSVPAGSRALVGEDGQPLKD